MISQSRAENFHAAGNRVIDAAFTEARPTQTAIEPFHLEPRCRVCRSDSPRQTVNSMLASGCSFAGIVRSLNSRYADQPDCDRVSVDSVRNHAVRHFPVQNLAQATYRDVLQQRAQQNQIDIAQGLATALTPMAFMEAIMAKAFAALTQDGTEVTVETGLRAAKGLQSVLDNHAAVADVTEMMAAVNKITQAVRSTVPESMWGDITAKLTGPTDRGRGSEQDDDDDGYDPE